MLTRILVAVVAVVAIVKAFAPGLQDQGALGIILVIAGVVYAATALDAEDATGFLVLAVAAATAAGSDVLGAIPGIGGHLDTIVGKISMALNAAVATVVVLWTVNRIKG